MLVWRRLRRVGACRAHGFGRRMRRLEPAENLREDWTVELRLERVEFGLWCVGIDAEDAAPTRQHPCHLSRVREQPLHDADEQAGEQWLLLLPKK